MSPGIYLKSWDINDIIIYLYKLPTFKHLINNM